MGSMKMETDMALAMVVLMAIVFCGEPDLIDALIHWLMNSGCASK